MDEILRTAIDKHKALILEPRILEVINGKSLLEDESEIKVRIDSEFYVEKSGKLYFPLHFDYKFTESQKNHPELSLEETVLFAAKRELKEWNNRREAIVWFDRAYEQIVDDYALLLAYREIYDLHYKTRTPFEGVSEFDSLRDDDIEELEVVSTGAKEQREASYMAIQGENKEILIKEFTQRNATANCIFPKEESTQILFKAITIIPTRIKRMNSLTCSGFKERKAPIKKTTSHIPKL